MSRFVFPYGIRFQENGRVEVFPAAEILVLGRGSKGLRTLFHVDSGATTSVLSSRDALALGIDYRQGQKTLVRGFSGEALLGYRGVVALEFGRRRIKIPIIFVEHDFLPRILGREGVFPHFGVLFYEAKKKTAFLDTNKKEIRGILDKLIREV